MKLAPSCLPSIVALAAGLVGCASTRLDAQWADPQRPALRGARVLVACDAREAVIKRLCEEHVAAEIVARGATPVIASEATGAQGHAEAARGANARAILVQQIVPYGGSVSPGLEIGIGAFGVGGGGFGGGVGVSAPIGGGQVLTGYSADISLTDAQTGRMLWSAKASSPPSQDVQSQLKDLTRTVFDSADKLGVF